MSHYTRRSRNFRRNAAEVAKQVEEIKKKIAERSAELKAEREAIIASGGDPDSPEYCKICKAGVDAGPVHGNCLYGGRKIGHSRGHRSANACY